jgi:hypothetical protein
MFVSENVTAEKYKEIIMQLYFIVERRRTFLVFTAGWPYLTHCKLNNGNA